MVTEKDEPEGIKRTDTHTHTQRTRRPEANGTTAIVDATANEI